MKSISGFVVDIEADGPIPGEYSMIEIGAVLLKPDLKRSPVFEIKLRPITDHWVPAALAISGYSRELTMEFPPAEESIVVFADWILTHTPDNGRPMMFSDNNGFDFMYTHWYFMKFLGEDPFGHTSRNIADLYRGLKKDYSANFKKLRKTKHTHNPLDDAMGNAEALLSFIKSEGMQINLEGF